MAKLSRRICVRSYFPEIRSFLTFSALHAGFVNTYFITLPFMASFFSCWLFKFSGKITSVRDISTKPGLTSLCALCCCCVTHSQCCWSGTAGLYRPGILLDSRPIWNGEFSLVDGLPTIREGGYTAVRMVDVGSMSSGCVWVAQIALRNWLT